MQRYIEAGQDFSDLVGRRLSRNTSKCITLTPGLLILEGDVLEFRPAKPFKELGVGHLMEINKMEIHVQLKIVQCVNGDLVF